MSPGIERTHVGGEDRGLTPSVSDTVDVGTEVLVTTSAVPLGAISVDGPSALTSGFSDGTDMTSTPKPKIRFARYPIAATTDASVLDSVDVAATTPPTVAPCPASAEIGRARAATAATSSPGSIGLVKCI